MSEFPQVTPHTVEFDVQHEDGKRLGSMVTWALPRAGDRLHVHTEDDPEYALYVVVRADFDPNNITVIVRNAD